LLNAEKAFLPMGPNFERSYAPKDARQKNEKNSVRNYLPYAAYIIGIISRTSMLVFGIIKCGWLAIIAFTPFISSACTIE